MEQRQYENLLQLHPNTVSYVRSLYSLDDTKRMDEAISTLQDWISKQNHFSKKDFPRKYLETSLINNKGSIEKTKSKLDKLCTLRTVLPQFFNYSELDECVKDLMKCFQFAPLPKLTEDHYRVILLTIENNEYFQKARFIDCFGLFLVMLEFLMMHDYSNGVIFVLNYTKINPLDIVPKLNPLEMKQLAKIIFDGYGLRIGGLHFITESSAVQIVIKIIRGFFPAKIAKRLFVHKNYNELHEIVPKDILPIEVGGTERSHAALQQDWFYVFSEEENLKFINWIRMARIEQSQRGDDNTYIEYLGLAGSFRALQFD